MIYQTTCGIIFKGDRVKKGVQLDLTNEEAAHLGTDVALVSSQAPKDEVKKAAGTDKEPTHAELKAKAGELGLSKAGSIADLKERIKLFLDTMEEREVTAEDLEANPALVEKGVKVGDKIFLPKDEVKS